MQKGQCVAPQSRPHGVLRIGGIDARRKGAPFSAVGKAARDGVQKLMQHGAHREGMRGILRKKRGAQLNFKGAAGQTAALPQA